MKKSSFTGTGIKVPGKHFLLIMKMFLIVLLTSTLFSVAQAAQQQKKQLSGTVADASGEPLIGAGIIEKGTTNGTLTNINGSFSLQVEENAIIQVSYIGYLSQEINTSGRTTVNITLMEDTRSLEEVVVVGYGTQKKANLTGAVDQVGEKVFAGRPMPNVTQGLQGVVPNLNISLADGKPSRTASYQIRGVTSIGQGGSALVMIDGVEGDPAMLNPNDIASISVLKDASSAAIYGARGAFGVVLITTKNPEKGRTSITYNSSVVAKSPTRIPDMVTDANLYATMFVEAYSSYYDYARTPSTFHKAVPYNVDWHNEMARRPPGSGKPEVEIGSDGNYQYFANNNWYEMLYRDRSFGHEHNIAIQGGTDKADFILSARYYDQNGVFRYNSDDYSMMNIRAKGSAQIFNWLNVENNVAITQSNYFNPLTVADGNVWYGLESEAEPMSPMFNPDGTLTMAAAYSVGDMWYGKSGINTKRMLLHNTTSFTASFLDNAFRLKGDLSFRNPYTRETTKRVPVPYSPAPDVIAYLGSGTNDFGEANSSTNYMATNIYGEYEKTFADAHYFKGMLGYNYEQSLYNSIFTQRNGLIFEDVDNINLTNGSGITISGSHEKWRIAGGFFRLNYGFKDRYLLEVNGRLDGSTKFPVDQQWGFFPSISAGWRLSEEPFWNLNNIFSDVKLRASYGSLGVGNIASYTFQELFSISTMGRLIQGARQQKTSVPPVLPDGLTWETSTTANLGLDFGVFKGRLRFAGDIYTRKTRDMFAVGIDLPATFGATAPKGNYADMKTNGWEMAVSWRNDHTLAGKPFSYDVRVTLADYVSKITKYTNPEKELGGYWDARVNYYEGMTIGEIWGYVTEGFFTSDEDVANHASQRLYFASNSGQWLPGDIKFKDLNKDGVIDYGTNKVNDPGDRKIIGNTTPRYTYGINLGVNWSDFFISGFFQGVGKQDWWPGTDNALFWGQYNRPYNNIPKSMLGNIWTEDNRDAYFPRYRGYVALQSSRELAVTQTRYLQNVAYIRLKNLQIGYNLPRHLASAVRMQNARIYMSAENIWGWSPLYKITKNFDFGSIYGTDIEQAISVPSSGIANGSQVYNYPVLKSISFGISVTF
jgi:TonB-linked SusC/RagA family outer membrane protein